jgi:hypothetical protein
VRASGLPMLLLQTDSKLNKAGAPHSRGAARPPGAGYGSEEEEGEDGAGAVGGDAAAAVWRLQQRHANLEELGRMARGPAAAAALAGDLFSAADAPAPEAGLGALLRFKEYASLASGEDADSAVPKVGPGRPGGGGLSGGRLIEGAAAPRRGEGLGPHVRAWPCRLIPPLPPRPCPPRSS